MFRYILFDFDGTVYDTVEGIARSVRYAINKYGIDEPETALRRFAGPPLRDKFMEEYGFSEEQAMEAIRIFRERYLPVGLYESRAFEGIAELLAELRKAGCKTAVATSKPQPLAEKLLRDAGIFDLFDAVCGSSIDGGDDAKWQVAKRAMEALGADPSETALIGDTKYDVEGAHRCKIPCIGVRWGYAAEGELESAGADYIAAGMDELINIVLK